MLRSLSYEIGTYTADLEVGRRVVGTAFTSFDIVECLFLVLQSTDQHAGKNE